ncbi:MAG TPA: c-type cytochrome [Planctomycetota bacterium]|jgi:mono/diheme cytochrome c family protein|nr:c-type cytochrome [Planctomycetota bacterium]
MTKKKLASNWIWIAGVTLLGTGVWMSATASAGDAETAQRVARGKYLVDAIGCADCHTPLVMGPNGPARDPNHHLAGHPQQLVMPAAPKLGDGPWAFVSAGTMTAWSGPWGTSFTANLTPDRETGLGAWTEEQFMATIRTQRHLGKGRAILPPMPASVYANLNDEDLRSVFAYLQSIPAVKNRVPQPLPPAEAH